MSERQKALEITIQQSERQYGKVLLCVWGTTWAQMT